MSVPRYSPVTDAMVERAWAAIVGRDIAPQCFNASIIRGDLRTALESVIGAAQQPAVDVRKLLGAFYKTVDVMKSARNSEAKMMNVWADDMKAVEDVMVFLENLRDAGFAQPSASPDPEAWMRDDGSAATINPMIAAGWKAQGGRAIPLYAAPQAASVAQEEMSVLCSELTRLRNENSELAASVAQTATREALEEINALISNGDRPTVNERNAFEHFTTLNRLLLNIRDIARRALSSVPSTTRGACHDHPTKRCTPDDCCQSVSSKLHCTCAAMGKENIPHARNCPVSLQLRGDK